MARLTDDAVQNHYVTRILDLHDKWATLSEAQRRATLIGAIREAMQAVHVSPLLTITWTDGDAFSRGDWSLELDTKNAKKGLHPFKDWADRMTSPYHEIRHAEQYTIVLEAYCRGALALPVVEGTREVVPNVKNEPGGIVASIANRTGVPIGVVRFAYLHRMEFKQDEIPMARAWSDSFFGGQMAYKQYVQGLNTRAPNWEAYINLPGERDAFAIEKEVRNRIRTAMGRTLEPTGVQGLTDEESETLGALSSLYRPSYKEWMEKTTRGILHRRSAQLTQLDNKLLAFESNKATVAELKTAFDRWYVFNPKEAAARNKDGVVDRLREFVGS